MEWPAYPVILRLTMNPATIGNNGHSPPPHQTRTSSAGHRVTVPEPTPYPNTKIHNTTQLQPHSTTTVVEQRMRPGSQGAMLDRHRSGTCWASAKYVGRLAIPTATTDECREMTSNCCGGDGCRVFPVGETQRVRNLNRRNIQLWIFHRFPDSRRCGITARRASVAS
jgi:hypothetical protein